MIRDAALVLYAPSDDQTTIIMTAAEPPIEHYWTSDDSSSLNGYWFDELGWIAYYFAQLEGASYMLIECLEKVPAVRDACLNLPYASRSKVAAGLIAAHVAHDATLASEWTGFWSRAIDAAPIRNKVLHNRLTKDLLAGEKMEADDGVRLRDTHRTILKLGTVQTYSRKLVELNKELSELLKRTSIPDPA